MFKPSLILTCLFCLGAGASEQPDWPWLRPTPVVQGLRALSHITHAGDGSERIFAVQLAGQIRIIDRTGQLLSQPFLDIASRIRPMGEGEAGLWSVAFPPGFAQSRRCYVAYSRASDGAFVVSRFALSSFSSNVTDQASERVLLVHPHPGLYHYGGQIAFGPDGFLYISCGDGHQPLQVQQLDNFSGKLLRIDPEGAARAGGSLPYRIPTTNPFVNHANAKPEIWALGLRNPWRFSFDRATGDLYLGDVGELSREEINFQQAASAGGANYGWPDWEGTRATGFSIPPAEPEGFAFPALEYSREDGGSVIGGFVYRGPSQPRVDGLYVFGDFVSGFVWGAKGVGTNWLREAIAPRLPLMTTFGEDEAGRLLIGTLHGRLYRMEDSQLTLPPRFEPRGYDSLDGDVSRPVYTDQIRIVARSTNSVLRYTFELRTPNETDALVPPDGIVVVTNGTYLSTRAWQAGRDPSDVETSFFQIQTAPPKFSPPPGQIANGTAIAISSDTAGAVIHYTVNGGEPTIASPVYTEPLLFSLEQLRQGVLLRTVAVRPGFQENRLDVTFALPQVDIPTFDPPPGPINEGTPVSIHCATPGATIHFETNGTPATVESPVYAGPLVINGGTFLRALATRNDLRTSHEAAANYPRAAETNFGFLSFSQYIYSVSESARTTTITVVRSGPTNLPAWVELTTRDSGATAGLDYMATNGVLYFPGGSTSQIFSITVHSDTLAELTENVSLGLQNASNAFLQSSFAQLSVIDDDPPGTIEFSALNYDVNESQPVARVVVKRTGGRAAGVSALVYTGSGTATSGADFVPFETNVVFATDQTQKTVEIPLRDDLFDELDEMFDVYLSSTSGGATIGFRNHATVTVRDNDPTSLIEFAQKTTRVNERNGTARVALTRIGDAKGPATVSVYAYARTAAIGDDFIAGNPTVTFAPGERTKEFTLTLVNDDLAEGPEMAELLLSEGTGALLGTTRLATLLIDDDEFRLLGSYRLEGTTRIFDCTPPEKSPPTAFAGRLEITNQTGSNFQGRAVLVGTTAGGYADLTMNGLVSSDGKVFGSLLWNSSSGVVTTGSWAGIAKSDRLSLSFTNSPSLDGCRQRGQIKGVSDLSLINSVTPVLLSGRTLLVTPSRTSGSFAGRQSFRIEFTGPDQCTVSSDLRQFAPFVSRFVYERTGARAATIWMGDEQNRNQHLNLSFTSSSEGSFSGRAAADPGGYSGRFQFSP